MVATSFGLRREFDPHCSSEELGVAPLLSMAAHRAHLRTAAPMVLQVAARTMADVLLWPELQQWEAKANG